MHIELFPDMNRRRWKVKSDCRAVGLPAWELVSRAVWTVSVVRAGVALARLVSRRVVCDMAAGV